jgi:hypothetical protein
VPENGTFVSDRLIHTGQFFVPDGLNQQIDKVSHGQPCAALLSPKQPS